MDFTLDPDLRDLRQSVGQAFAKLDAASPLTPAGRQDAWRRVAELGLLDLGPDGLDPVALAQVADELGRTRIRIPLAETVVAWRLLERLGPAEVRATLLPAISGGTEIVALAHAVPRAPVGTAAHGVRAERDGADRWVLTGSKEPVPYAGWATSFLVTAVADGETRLFLLRRDEAGVEVLDYDTHDHVGAGRVTLDGAPAAALGGEAGTALAEAFAAGAAVLCAEAVGAMDAALSLTVDHLRTRRQFDVTLQRFQALQHRAADMCIELEMARSTASYAAMALAADPADTLAVSRAKVQVGRSGRLVGQNAIQLHGGIGITDEHPIGHYVSRLEAVEHAFGGTEIHLRELARALDTDASVELLT